MQAACRSYGGGHAGGRGSRGNRGAPPKLESGTGPSIYKKAKGKGGKDNLATTTCFNCLKLGHVSYTCKEPKVKRA